MKTTDVETKTAKYKLISSYIIDHPESAALVLMKTNASGVVSLLNNLPVSQVAKCLNLFPDSILVDILSEINETQLGQLLEELTPNKAASSIRLMIKLDQKNKIKIEKRFLNMKKDCVQILNRLLTYPDQSVGSIMDPVPFSVRENIIVKELMFLLRKKKHRYSRYIYVVDSNECLLGVFPFKDSFYSEKKALVSELMTSTPISMRAERDIKKAFSDPNWKRWNVLPVTDSGNKLMGVIRYEVLEQILKGSGLPEAKNVDIMKAGSAVGDVLQIAVSGAASALGFDERK